MIYEMSGMRENSLMNTLICSCGWFVALFLSRIS